MIFPLLPLRPVALAAAFAAAACVARPAAAQKDPLGLPSSTAAEMRQQFLEEARAQVTTLLARYDTAWQRRDVDRLAAFYDDEAVVYPAAAGMLTGRPAVRDYFARLLPSTSALSWRLMDFTASGDMATAIVQVSYQVGDEHRSQSLTFTDVYILHRDPLARWSIVSQLSRPEQVWPSLAAPRDTARQVPPAPPE